MKHDTDLAKLTASIMDRKVLLYILERCFMTKESVKNFFKDHKDVIVKGTVMTIGGTILAIIGVKAIKDLQSIQAKSNSFLNDDKTFIDLVNTIDEASAGCKQYVKLTLPEIAAAIDKDGIVRDCVKDPNGNLFEIKNLIALGNKVEP